MSQLPNSESVVSYELLVCSDPMALPAPVHRGPDLVYEELNRLAELMPLRYADVFRFRWGLATHFPHLTSQTARKFEIPQSTAEEMLTRCLWNVARYAHRYHPPAIRALVGENSGEWAARAWEHGNRRWGSDEACCSGAVLLLAAAGMDVREANWRAKHHMVDIGIRRRGKKWGRPLTAEQQADASREAIDRILRQIVWPTNTARFSELDAFETCRPLPSWAPARSGVFRSATRDRLVQFDSELEFVMMRDFETDPRVVDYREQPVTIPYVIAGEAHEYTPDVIRATR